MLSRFGGGLLGISALLVSIGILLHNPYTILLSFPLLMYIMIATILYRVEDIKIEREIKRKEILFEKDVVDINIKISGKFIGLLTIIQEISTPNKKIVFRKSMKKPITINEKLKIDKFGVYKIFPTKAIYTDYFGIYLREFCFCEEEEFKVYPKIEKLSIFKVFPKLTSGVFGEILSKYKGSSTEFYEIREYSPGDSYKSINWKCFARVQKPMVNEKYDERSTDVIILVDMRNAGELFDKFVRATCSIATTLLKMRNRVGIVAVGKSIRWVYPKSGKYQGFVIMNLLTQMERGKSMIKIEHLSFLLRRFFPPGSFIIFISALRDKRVEDLLWELIGKGHRILLINPYSEIKGDTIGIKIKKMQRIFSVKRFRRFIPVVEWDVSMPLENSLKTHRRLRYG